MAKETKPNWSSFTKAELIKTIKSLDARQTKLLNRIAALEALTACVEDVRVAHGAVTDKLPPNQYAVATAAAHAKGSPLSPHYAAGLPKGTGVLGIGGAACPEPNPYLRGQFPWDHETPLPPNPFDGVK